MLRLIGILLRVYGYVFETLLSLSALAFSAIVLASPHETIRVGWLPGQGQELGAALAVFGVIGLVAVFLAISGRVRFLLTLFALTALVVVTRGLFFSTWRFEGLTAAQNGFHFVLALFTAFLGSIPAARRNRSGYRR